ISLARVWCSITCPFACVRRRPSEGLLLAARIAAQVVGLHLPPSGWSGVENAFSNVGVHDDVGKVHIGLGVVRVDRPGLNRQKVVRLVVAVGIVPRVPDAYLVEVLGFLGSGLRYE